MSIDAACTTTSFARSGASASATSLGATAAVSSTTSAAGVDICRGGDWWG